MSESTPPTNPDVQAFDPRDYFTTSDLKDLLTRFECAAPTGLTTEEEAQDALAVIRKWAWTNIEERSFQHPEQKRWVKWLSFAHTTGLRLLQFASDKTATEEQSRGQAMIAVAIVWLADTALEADRLLTEREQLIRQWLEQQKGERESSAQILRALRKLHAECKKGRPSEPTMQAAARAIALHEGMQQEDPNGRAI